MAILLCAAMTFSVLPSAAAKAEDEGESFWKLWQSMI